MGFSLRACLFIQVLLRNEAPGMHDEAAATRFKRCRGGKILLKIFAWMSGRLNIYKKKTAAHVRELYSGDLFPGIICNGINQHYRVMEAEKSTRVK